MPPRRAGNNEEANADDDYYIKGGDASILQTSFRWTLFAFCW
jgi:hypothetical protein